MSAGGLSYDLLTTSRKATLPSVEMWNTNMNILQDPLAGKYTRRIDKVGDTQSILLAQDDSGDRIAEMINVYARGVNPMVSVSYDNYGNNGGAKGEMRNQQVKLIYRPEVFRPPIIRQEDLMPLSRQPRTWFYALTNPELPNVINQMSCNETKSSTVQNPLRADAPPTYQQTIETIQPVSDRKAINDTKTPYEIMSNLGTTLPLSERISPKILNKIKSDIIRLKDVLTPLKLSEQDNRTYKNTTVGIQKKIGYEILTNKIQQLEQILSNTDASTTKNIKPGNQFGTWVSGNRDQAFRGTDTFVPHSVNQASNPHLYTKLEPRTLLPHTERWIHPETPELTHRRPIASIESLNHGYNNTKNIMPDSLESGRIDTNKQLLSAFSNKSSFDKQGDLGETVINDRRVLLIEDTTTARDTSTLGDNLYQVQSRDGLRYNNNRPNPGSFHSIGNAIPSQEYSRPPSEVPVQSQWNDVKREAYKQYQSRFI